MSKELPPSRRIAQELREKIESGELAPGAVLPSERELMRQYKIAASTANKVITLMKATGLVESQVGRGVFVRRRAQLIRHGYDRYAKRHRTGGKAPFRAEVEAQGRVPRVAVTGIQTIEAPAWVRERLGLAEGAQVVKRSNVYFVDENPTQAVNTYIPESIAAGTTLMNEVPGPGGIYAAFEAQGHELTRMVEEVTARQPNPEEARLLNVLPGVPVLDILHVSFDQDDLPMDVSHFVLAGDENVLTYELPVS